MAGAAGVLGAAPQAVAARATNPSAPRQPARSAHRRGRCLLNSIGLHGTPGPRAVPGEWRFGGN